MVQAQPTVLASDGTFDSLGGFHIFFRSWRPSLPPRAAVLIVPGFNAHSAYYAWAAERLAADRLAVYALDLRGRGHSDGERFYVDTFADYVSDVAHGFEVVRKEFPLITLPVLILHGTADKATRPGGSQCFYDTVGSNDKSLKLYEGHVHDLLNDLGRDAVIADIRWWIEVRLSTT
jgi:alpha-beta hydrolase superfamily lysophospholipase